MDPVNVSIHFHNKWDAIFKLTYIYVLKNSQFFGKVAMYIAINIKLKVLHMFTQFCA